MFEADRWMFVPSEKSLKMIIKDLLQFKSRQKKPAMNIKVLYMRTRPLRLAHHFENKLPFIQNTRLNTIARVSDGRVLSNLNHSQENGISLDRSDILYFYFVIQRAWTQLNKALLLNTFKIFEIHTKVYANLRTIVGLWEDMADFPIFEGAGSALSNFYAQNGLANGAQFGWFLLAVICLKYSYISRTGVSITGSQFCTKVINSNANCPTQASDLLKCRRICELLPSPRGSEQHLLPGELSELPKRGPVNVTTVTTDDGTKWIALMGAELFEVGNTIWTEDKNATSAAKATGAIDAAASTVVGKKVKIVSVN
ncbi:hypothetical protein EW146_g9801 [Bondarzewia mesenterica]|uniref:Uncharacterized protein n=1 Tax=Bondarzewia mesenterica TaxID=1095465 RepID=A0A4S4L3N5_9AGAM|nr:hypothetical protein EW146_g9801 [Bondarzewia mesenterica]